MRTVDYIVFAVYLVGILALGLAVARRKQTAADYHVASRTMWWLPIGLSIVATAFSAINFTQFSGEVFANGLYVTMAIPLFLVVAWPVSRWIIPFFYATAPISAYEYLEKRFDLRARRLASALFVIWRVFWMAVVLYATAAFLGAISNIDVLVLIFITGTVTTAYTFAGGIRSVIWTDVAQFIVLLGSLVVGAVAATSMQGGFVGVLRTASHGGILKPFHPFDPAILSFDPTIRMTMWSVGIGAFTAFLARYGVDQMVVQRYFTARSLDDARRAFYLNILLSMVTLVFLAFIGIAIYCFAQNTVITAGKPNSMMYLAAFVKSLPYGICGLLVSGLCAATMSSIDSGVHSCSTAVMSDLLNPRMNTFETANKLIDIRIDRWLTLAIGAAATVLACYVGKLGSIFEIANRIINGLGSPLLALCLLGWFGRSITPHGFFWGGLAGIAFSIYTGFGMEGLALHYYAVINLLATLTLCWLFSVISMRKAHT